MMDDANSDAARLNQTLVDQLKKSRAIRSSGVEMAFRTIPRHLFLPDSPLEQVYADAVVPTKFEAEQAISSSSQPSMMAIMLEQGAFKPGMRVLEIGAGTGYNAALMAAIVGENGHVTTIDIDEDIVTAAREHLAAAGMAHRVTALRADGWAGYPPNAPYDRILLSVQARDLSPAWVDSLKNNGRLVLPLDVWAGAQLSIAFVKKGDALVSISLVPCGFMPLRGESAAAPGELLWMGDQTRQVGQIAHTHTLETWDRLISQPYTDHYTGVESAAYVLANSGFWLWLASHADQAVEVLAKNAEHGVLPLLFDKQGAHIHTIGLATSEGIALLMRDPHVQKDVGIFRVWARHWGEVTPLRWLMGSLRQWDHAGQPDARKLKIAAFPVSAPPKSLHSAVTVTKLHFRFVLKW